MKLTKIKDITESQIKQYKSQKCITRNREVKGAYESIVLATDQDLD